MNWDHSICDGCWWKFFAGRSMPCRVDFDSLEADTCHFCGEKTLSGIYVRLDPADPILASGHTPAPNETAQ